LNRTSRIENLTRYETAVIGKDHYIEEGVEIGFPYHEKSGPARVGDHCQIHSGTIIYADVTIGDYFQAGHYVVIRAVVKMGDYCTVMNHSAIEGIVRFGDGVRIMSNCYIPSRTWFGDNVFVGPGVTFLNDRHPGRRDPTPQPRGATVDDDVMIGGGCTILPGVHIGERSFIAAGAVVNKDVPARSFVKGVPGEISPLPDSLDMPNNRELTLNPNSFWDPDQEYSGSAMWPDYWSEGFED
jgi:acetyltransferase-like isoleucine patch superfamily enzyme